MSQIPFFLFSALFNYDVTVNQVVHLVGLDTEAGFNAAQAVDDPSVLTQNDPYGLMMAMLGMGIVFIALLLFYIIFTNTPRLYTTSYKEKLQSIFSRKKPAVALEYVPKSEDARLSELTGEVNAAIAAAIFLYRSELHDHENTVLTIKKVARTYSPWSSKIYGLRNLHR